MEWLLFNHSSNKLGYKQDDASFSDSKDQNQSSQNDQLELQSLLSFLFLPSSCKFNF